MYRNNQAKEDAKEFGERLWAASQRVESVGARARPGVRFARVTEEDRQMVENRQMEVVNEEEE